MYKSVYYIGMLGFFLSAFATVGRGFESKDSGSVRVRLNASPPEFENSWFDRTLIQYNQSAFAFTRIPQAYTENGTRDEWPNPLQVVAEAEIALPKGHHQFLLRSRRGARLWIDGKIIAENPFPENISDGHDPVERSYLDLGEGVRFLGPGDQEMLVDWTADGSMHQVRLEFYVGGFSGESAMRPETGETLVAISLEGVSGFEILSTQRRVLLTDLAWKRFYEEQMNFLDTFDRERRLELRSSEDDYWEKRHAFARSTIEKKRMLAKGDSTRSIDAFIDRRIERANQAIDSSKEAEHFLENVRPLLEKKCWDCHGKKAKGGLRLDSRGTAMIGGESDIPALSAGKPEESYLLEMIRDEDPEFRMPPKGDALTEAEIEALVKWIEDGAVWPETMITNAIEPVSKNEDLQFLRRLYLDTIGLPPTKKEIEAFLIDNAPDKRNRVIDRLLTDLRWSDHWVSYWQDVLAENPTIVNPTLNNTGPFRYWIHEAFQDNLSMDRFVTDLTLMEGSLLGGGPGGFEMASQNDVPMAAKANILSNAFMATEMKCSRCHDAPFHDNKQEDLFGIAAMLAQKPLIVPATSSVPMDKLHANGRKSLIEVTLAPGSTVEPHWPFSDESKPDEVAQWLRDPENTRERLAYHLTSPDNGRFAKVMVNRLWQRLFGRGLVEPVGDWENAVPLHPGLLEYLGDELVISGYDLKKVARLIMNSNAYQRRTSEDPTTIQYFAAQGPRGLSAEQIVDSLFAATGLDMETEILTVDVGGGRPWSNAVSLGKPERAWMFGGMANNRDRPSLILPRAQAVIDVMTAFGWRASRQEPIDKRNSPLSPLKPAILNNGIMSSWLSRLSDAHEFTDIAIHAQTCRELVDTSYLRILGRYPITEERAVAMAFLEPGFPKRVVETDGSWIAVTPREPKSYVTWGNHLHPDADGAAMAAAVAAKAGDPPTKRLDADWRERMEDFVWSLINLPETIHYP